MNSLKMLLILVLTILPLAGCSSSSSDYQPKAGDPVHVSLRVDDSVAFSETYRFYSVDDEGNLSATPLINDESRPHIALFENQAGNTGAKVVASPIPVDSLRLFYKNLWGALCQQYPALSPQEIARQIGDLDRPIEEIYNEYNNSGLDIRNYVAFYESLDTYFTDGNTEGALGSFMENAGTTPARLLTVLQQNGSTWENFLALMVARKATFTTLYEDYAQSHLPIEDFLVNYINSTPGKAAFSVADPAKIGLKVAKFAWEIIKDNRPATTAEGAYTSILSSRDDNYENYSYAQQGTSKVVEFRVEGVTGKTLVTTKMRLTGYYNAVHRDIGGKWLPSVAFTVDNAYAFWGHKLNANAVITSAVNLASQDKPEPQIEVIAKVQNDWLFYSFIKSYKFSANGAKGFSWVP